MGQSQSSPRAHVSPEIPASNSLGPNGRYKMGHWLNEGQFGKVRAAFDTLKNKDVAIKFISRGPNLDVENVTKEIKNHRTLCHPHVIEFKEVFLTDRALCIVMEYAAGGDMQDYITKHKCLPEDWARWFFQQIIIAIEYCHKREVVLRDIKLENLLLDKDHQLVKVCDFGFSKHHQHDSAPQTCVGTLSYLAPEVLRSIIKTEGGTYDGEMVDIWTCGVCLYVMLYGAYPYDHPGDSSQEYYRRILQGKVNFMEYQERNSVKEKLSPECLDLLRRMLDPKPLKRITLKGIKSHEWFLEKLPEGSLDYNNDVETIDENHIVSTRKLQSAAEIERLVKEAARLPSR